VLGLMSDFREGRQSPGEQERGVERARVMGLMKGVYTRARNRTLEDPVH